MNKNAAFSRVMMPRVSVELKWQSKTGMNYQVEESTDLTHWQPALPAPFIGTGGDMTWTAPQCRAKKSYRIRES